MPKQEVSVKLHLAQRYATAGQTAIVCQAELKDGTAPYTVRFTVSLDGGTVHEETVTAKKAGQIQFTYMPQSFGVHEVKVTVTDDSGKKASAKASLPVSVLEEESAQDWAASVEGVTLTGDWRKDLPAIAATQLGYEESRRNFIIDENGEQQGYTRYGHWYGMTYEEWCAMFVSFCLHYADIPAEWFPREAECGRWKAKLENIGAYEERGGDYVPQKGDLVFFNYDSDSTPDHIGIVVDTAENQIFVIAGNENRSVLKREYGLADSSIVGYANMEHIMERAGVLEKFEQTEETEGETGDEGETENKGETGNEDETETETAAEPESVIGRKIYTNTDSVNLRELPNVASAAVGRVEAAGTELVILDVASNGEETWYQITYDGITAWIRSDLTELGESETENTPESESETEDMSESESETEDMLENGEPEENGTAAGEEAQITIHTEQENVKVGEEITFIAEVYGLENAAFQWQYSEDGESWEDIEDETGLSYTTVVTDDNSSYYYRLAALAAAPGQSGSQETAAAETAFAETAGAEAAGVETASAEATFAETAGAEMVAAATVGAETASAEENQETTDAPGLFAMRKVMAAEEKKPEQTAQQIFSNAMQMPLDTMRAAGPIHLNPKNTPDKDAQDEIVKKEGTVKGTGTADDPMLHYAKAFEAAKENGSNMIYFWNPYAEFVENGSAEVSNFTGAVLDGEGIITLAQYTTKHNGYLFEIANNEEDWSLSNMTLSGSYPLIGMLGGKAALDSVEMNGGTIFFEYIDSEFPQKPRLTVSNIPEGDTYVVKFGEYTADTAIAASSKHRAPLIRLEGENAKEMAKQIVLDKSLQNKYKLIFRNNTVYVTENNDYRYVFLSADRGYDDDGILDDIDAEDGLTPYTPVNTMETAVKILRENPDLGGIRVIGKAPEVTEEAVWDMSEFAGAGKNAVERWDGSYIEGSSGITRTMLSSSPVMCDGPIAVVTGALTLKDISLTGKNDATLKVSGSLVMEAGAYLQGNENKAQDNSKNESWKPGGAVYADGNAVVTVKSGAFITGNSAEDGSSIYATGSAQVTVESGADIVTEQKTYKVKKDDRFGTLDQLPRVGSLIYADGNAKVSYSGTISGTSLEASIRDSTTDNMAMFYARSGAVLTLNGVQITNNSGWRFIICTESGGNVTLEAGTQISGNTGAERIINMGGIIGDPTYRETSAGVLKLNGTAENPIKIADNSDSGCAVYTRGSVTASYAEITGNESSEEYSGLCATGGSGGTVDHCKINNNTSDYYAGVYFDLRSGYPVTVTDTEISGNIVNGTSGGSIAGLCLGNYSDKNNTSWVPQIRVQNCTIKENMNNAGGFAGLRAISSTTGTVISDTEVTGNQSTGNAGIDLFGDERAVLARTTVEENRGDGKSGIILSTTSIGTLSVMLALTGDCRISEGQKVYFGSNRPLRLLTPIEQENKISLVLGETADSSYFSVGRRVVVPYDGTLTPSDLGYDSVEFLTDVTGEIGKFAGENMPQDPYPTQLAEDNPDIILAEQGIYLDGVNGDDGRNGLTPGTAVKTFEKAKEKLIEALKENPDFNPVIIICGMVTVDNAANWSLADVTVPEGSSELKRETLRVKRYSRVNDTALVTVTAAGSLTADGILWDGAADEMISEQDKYSEAIIVVKGGTLTLKECTMQDNESYNGRRTDHTGGGALTAYGGKVNLADTAIMNTQSSRGALYFRGNVQATLDSCTITGNSRSSSSTPGQTWADGGGISAENGAAVTVKDSIIEDNTTEATHGGHGIAALNATVTLIGTGEGKSKTQPLIYMGEGGKLILGGALASTVEGKPLEIYLRDTAIGLAGELSETTECLLGLHSDFAGRIVVESNKEKTVEAGQYLDQFELTEETKKLVPGLSVKDKTEDPDQHIWADGLHVYLDGQNGSDENSGSSPENAVKTFAAAKERLAKSSPGANIVICGRVDVSNQETWALTDADGNFTNSEGETWQPVIQRYREYYADYLVNVLNNGNLTMENLVLDGNSDSVLESTKKYPSGLICGAEDSKIVLASGTVLRNQKDESGSYVTGALYTEGEAEIQEGALITDCSNKYYPIVLVRKGGSLTLCGEIKNCTVASSRAIVLVGSESRDTSYAGSTLQIDGAYIHDCTASQIICVNDRSWLAGMKDTVIEKNDCGKTGAVVYLDLDKNTNKLEMTIQDSMIRDNKGTGVTANLSAAADRHTLTLNKVIITGNVNEPVTGGARRCLGGGVRIGESGNGGTVNIMDCTIESNEAYIGGGIYVGSTTAQVNISGGSISNNRSKDEGGGICFLRIPDGFSTAKYSDISASLKIENGTKICNNIAMADGDADSSSLSSLNYAYGGGIHAICPNVMIDSSVEISGNFAAVEGGGVYINTYRCSSPGEVTIDAQITGNTANNGAGIAVNGSEGCKVLLNGAVTGNKIREDKNGYITWTRQQQSAGVSVKGGPVECRADIKDNVGSRGVYVGENGHLTFSGGEISGHMNGFKGGEIKGGAVGVDRGGTFEMTGGKITGNAVGAEGCVIKGGAIYAGQLDNNSNSRDDASVIISGGEITGNAVEAAETVTQISGGAICADQYSNLTVSAGDIYENALGKAGLIQGGGIYVNAYRADLTMTGGDIYRNAEGGKIQGGGVHLYGYSSSSYGACAITGGTIRENGQTGLYETDQSKIDNGICTVNVGGGVYAGRGVSLTIGGDAVISRNTAQAGGGIYAEASGALTVGGNAIITENEAYEGNGGGVYTLKPTEVNGSAVISENRAAKDGGGIYFTDDNRNYGGYWGNSGAWESNLNGGYFLYNTAGGNGGALHLKNDASSVSTNRYVSIHNAYIEGNKAVYGQGIYCDQFRHIRLYGNQAVIEDAIYLRSTDCAIELAATCQNSNTYLVEVNDNKKEGLLYASRLFQVNSTVVTPYIISTAAAALRWFTVKNASYILMEGSSSKRNDIILGRCVFIDSVTGSDDFVFNKVGDHTGVNPDTAVKTFDAAKKRLGSSPGVIFVSGPVQIEGSETWSLSGGQSIRRYTGFAIGAKDVFPVYEGNLVEVKEGGNLTLSSNITIDGGSEYLDQAVEGCLIKVEGGGVLTANSSTKLQNNTTTGCGGAMRIEDGGTAVLNGGNITNTVAEQQGNAIYQDGKLVLTGSPLINGDIYLGEVQKDANGEPLAKPEEDVIQIKTYFSPRGEIKISLGDAYYTRPVVIYQDGKPAPETDKAGSTFVMAENVAAMYALANRNDRTEDDEDKDTLELTQPLVVYIDGVNGKDDWGFGDAAYMDGDTPDTAVKTLKRAYQLLAERGAATLFVVNTVTIESADITITSRSYTDTAGNAITIPEDKVPGGVAIRRYSQPYAWEEVTKELKDKYGDTYQGGYTKTSNVNELFVVEDGGALTIGDKLTVNGHSLAFPSANPRYNAPAVKGAALIRADGGSLTLEGDALLTRNSSVGDGGAVYVNGGTVTMFAAGITNTSAKNGGAVYAGAGSVVMPKEDGSKISTRNFQSVKADENGGAIYIAEGASAELYAGTEISYASAKEGSAVYQGGRFSVEGQMNVSGEVYLAADHYIDVNSGGFLNNGSWIIDPENPYEGRDIALYADEMEKPNDDEKAKFPLVEEVARFYYLNNEDESLIENGPRRANMLELQLPHFVYIDGVNGSDKYEDGRTELTIGTAPETAVKTLKKAYELLKERNCPRLYVVDTVTIDTSILLSEKRYAGSDGAVELDKEAEIMRYSQPNAAAELTGFNRESNKNALFKIAENGNLTLRSMVIDGHSTGQGGNKRTTAPAVEAQAPLIENAGTLRIASGTVLRNNNNAMENGRGGALYVNGGETIAYGGTIAGTAASLGSAVYLDGELKIYNSMQLGDLQVYLHSDDIDKPTGSYIYVETNEPNSGRPITVDFPNYVDYRVIAEYSDDLKPNADKYSEDVAKREAAGLLKVVEKQQVLLRKYPDEAKQINVTVPLYVCMYAYGGNGKVVTPTEEAYAITSRSNCPVQITSVQATEAIWDLKEKAAELKEAGELYLALDGQPVTKEKTDTSKNDRWLIPAAPLIPEDGDGDDGSGANRGPQNLSIQIDAAIAGGNVNEEGEARVCTVTYTVAAAEN